MEFLVGDHLSRVVQLQTNRTKVVAVLVSPESGRSYRQPVRSRAAGPEYVVDQEHSLVTLEKVMRFDFLDGVIRVAGVAAVQLVAAKVEPLFADRAVECWVANDSLSAALLVGAVLVPSAPTATE